MCVSMYLEVPGKDSMWIVSVWGSQEGARSQIRTIGAVLTAGQGSKQKGIAFTAERGFEEVSWARGELCCHKFHFLFRISWIAEQESCASVRYGMGVPRLGHAGAGPKGRGVSCGSSAACSRVVRVAHSTAVWATTRGSLPVVSLGYSLSP